MRLAMSNGQWALGIAALGFLVGGLAVGSWLSGAGPMKIELTEVMVAANGAHWLGTDDVGRDVLARLAAGVRVSVMVAAGVLAITSVLGITLGLVAGWYGGWVDRVVLKMTEVVLSFPGILLALTLAALVGGGLTNVIVALGVLGWVGFCRLARVEVMKLKGLPFVEAARLGGVDVREIWLRHILPNCAAPLIVEALLVVAGSMVAEAGLSFLGLGIPAPHPSLGGMLRDGMKVVLVAPQLVVYPAVVLIGLSVGVNMVAEGLRQRWAGGNEGR